MSATVNINDLQNVTAALEGMAQTPFMRRAAVLIQHSIPIVPLPPRTKAAKLSNWEVLATSALDKLQQLNPDPDGNTAAVARAEIGGFCFFEIDAPNFHEQIEQQTEKKFPETLLVSSSPGKGRGHFYFRHTPKSIALGNAQAKDERGELWSFRADNRYVVGPMSVKADGTVYTVINDAPIADCPDWLVEWIASNKGSDSGPLTASADGPKIPRGAHDTTLTRIAGKLRQDGLEEEAIYSALVEVCEKRCENYGSDYRDMCRKISKSVCRYAIEPPAPDVIMGNKNLSQQTVVPEQVEIPKIETPSHPKFPEWIFTGCHVYDNYIKEVCEKNSRYAEMMFVPALAIILNYVGTKCRIAYKGNINGSMVNIIGRKGRVIKSTSVQDMFDYYEHVGIFNHYGSGTRNSEGKSLCWTAGSTEGVGVSARRVNCRNILLYFDELKTLADKAGIEGSSMGGHLLSMLQSGKFANETKSAKGNFQFDPGTYTASVITCCTDRKFVRYWSKLIAFSDGLEDRATLILQPEQLKDVTPRVYVPASPEAIAEEKRLIDRAVAQQTYELEDDLGLLDEFARKYGNRSEIRAEEWALAFAIQRGSPIVDPSCIERGIALETYNIQVKKYLNVREAETREATIQNHIIQILMQNGGSIPMRDLNKKTRPDRYGTALWYNCYSGLIRNGWTAEIGTGVPGDPKRLVLLRIPENEDD